MGIPQLSDEERRKMVEDYDAAKARRRKGERGIRERVTEDQADLGKPPRTDEWDIFSGEAIS